MRKLLFLLLLMAVVPVAARKKSKAAVQPDTTICAEQRRLFEYFYLEGVRHRMNDDYSQAFYCFDMARSINPNSPDVLYEVGIMHMGLPGGDSLGGAMIEQAAKAQPINPYYLEAASRLALSREDYVTAVANLEQLSALLPTRTDVLSVLCELYIQQGSEREAIDVLNRIENLEGTSTELSMKKFVLYKNMKKVKQAFAEMEKLKRDNPHDMNIPLMLGRMYLNEGKAERALELYREVQRSNPNFIPLHMALMNYYFQQGQDSIALGIRDSLTLAPDVDTNTRVQLTYERMNELRLSNDSLPEAMRFFRSVVAQFPTPEMHAMGAYYLIDNDAPEDTIIVELRNLLRVSPADQRALELLLGYYFPKEDYEHAEEICRMGVNAYPHHIRYSFYLGAILSMNDRAQEAIEVLQSGIRQADSGTAGAALAESYSLMGDCYYGIEQREQAFAAYDSALVHNPNNAMCLNNYAYYLSLNHQQLDKAEQMAYRATQLEPLNKTYLDTYAWVLYCNGNHSMAKFYIDRVVRPSSTDEDLLADSTLSAEVVLHAADIYAANGDEEMAQRYRDIAKKKEENAKTE